MLDKRGNGVNATIYTKQMSGQLQLDIKKHNAQYAPITIKVFKKAHDRFLIIDDEVYLIVASLKDLGQKWFTFTLMEHTPRKFFSIEYELYTEALFAAWSAEKRRHYEELIMNRHDYDVVLQHSYDMGVEAGVEKGREEGRKKGKAEGTADAAKKMLASGMSRE